jgi:hypothetical protein
MKRLILAALLIAASIFAQAPQTGTKLVTLKYADPQSIISMVRMFGVNIQFNVNMKVMSLTGTPENIAAAEAAIRQLDVEPKNLELVAYFVVGTNLPERNGGAVPADVRDVITQLKSTFTLKEYSMLDTLSLRTRAGSAAETIGVLDASSSPRLTIFSIRNATVGDDGAIRIDRMHAGLRIPQSMQNKVDYMNTGIDQDVDVKEGQKVVVGRASLAGPEKALFVILTAKVVQ